MTTGTLSKQEQEFPAAASPHVFLLLPEGLQGEPAAQVLPELQEEGMLETMLNNKAAQTLVRYVQSIRPAAAGLMEQAKVRLGIWCLGFRFRV